MQGFNSYGVYDLGRLVGALGQSHMLTEDTVMTGVLNFHLILAGLEAHRFNRKVLTPARLNDAAFERFHALAVACSQEKDFPIGRPIGKEVAQRFHSATEAVERVLRENLPKLRTYILTKKRAFDLDLLIESPEEMLSEQAQQILSGYLLDNWREFGRCVVFEVPTAAAFFVLRVTEGVIRKYHKAITGRKYPAESGSVGVAAYLRAIRGKAREDVVAALSQLRAVHRNKTMHPGPVLAMPAAITLANICTGAIDTMAEDIVRRGKADSVADV